MILGILGCGKFYTNIWIRSIGPISLERDREEVLNIMRTVEAEVNVGIISDALQNSAEAIQAKRTESKMKMLDNIWCVQRDC